jgi:hypothetical protein
MLNLHGNRRRLAVLAGLSLALALAAAPTATAVPLGPDGGYEPHPQLGPVPGVADPAPTAHATSNGLDWSDTGLAVAFGLAAFAITAAALLVTVRRRSVIDDRSHPAPSRVRAQPLPRS